MTQSGEKVATPGVGQHLKRAGGGWIPNEGPTHLVFIDDPNRTATVNGIAGRDWQMQLPDRTTRYHMYIYPEEQVSVVLHTRHSSE